MAVSNKRQQILYAAVPRGFDKDGNLRVGVRISVRLAYDGEGATLSDFPDFLRWPVGGFWWSATFDGGTTWEPAIDEIWVSDGGFWKAAFHSNLRVDSRPFKIPTSTPAPIRPTITGYRYNVIAKGLQDFHLADRIDVAANGGSDLGGQLRPYLYPKLFPDKPDDDVAKFVKFYRPREATSAPPSRGRLDPDFHQRISLLADHGPLLARLGLVLELIFPARSSVIQKLAVRTNWETPDNPRPGTPLQLPTTHGSPYTRVSHVPGSRFVAAATSQDLDPGLRLRLGDPTLFSVHDVDVDSSLISAFGTAKADDDVTTSSSVAPPPPTSSGFVIAQASTDTVLANRIHAGNLTRDVLRKATADADGRLQTSLTDVPAEQLVQGYAIEVRRADRTSPEWRGLCQREVTYTAVGETPDANEISFTAVDEAPIGTSLRLSDADPGTFEVSDVLARWDGWSLGVPRPGTYQLQENATTGGVVDSPGVFPGGTVFMDAAIPAGARLHPLRFGGKYQFRARAVDVTGFAQPWTGAADATTVTAVQTYYRYEPVSAPLVLAPPEPTRTENSLRVVVRTKPGSTGVPATTRTIVPARGSVEMALAHGMFDVAGAPDPRAREKIAQLDETVPPDAGPPTVGGETSGVVVDWLPDPMSTLIGVQIDGNRDLMVKASFLKGTSTVPPEVFGVPELGHWQSVAIQLRGVSGPAEAGIKAVVDKVGHRVVPVALAPGETRVLQVRGLPPDARLDEHGFMSWLRNRFSDADLRVKGRGDNRLCPPVKLTLVHAYPRPIDPPSVPNPLTDVKFLRDTGQKDPTLKANLKYHADTTGQISIYASWEEWRDAGPAVPRNDAPERVEVVDTAFAEESGAKRPGPAVATMLIEGNLMFPDLRRRDVSLRATATARYLEEFREIINTGFTVVSGYGRLLDLPDDVEVESIRLLVGEKDLVRTRDYQLVEDPRTHRRTLMLMPNVPRLGIVVLGVRGSVTQSAELGKIVVPAAMRPLPPVVRYVLPAHVHYEGRVLETTGISEAARLGSRLRIWLERPWYSSGDGEKLAVVWQMTPQPATDDTDALGKLVTRLARDPMHIGEFPDRTAADLTQRPKSGADASVRLDQDIPGDAPGVYTQVHDVTYDKTRDLYWTDVEWPELPYGTFVRMAIARYQEHVTPGISQLSPIRTLDPIRLLPGRLVTAKNIGGNKIQVDITEADRDPLDAPLEGYLSVSLQKRTYKSSDPDLGWDVVSHGQTTAFGSPSRYAPVVLDRPTDVRGELRLVVEEKELFDVLAANGVPWTGGGGKDAMTKAVNDLVYEHPIFVATLPVPKN